jgi:hypothetical protein
VGLLQLLQQHQIVVGLEAADGIHGGLEQQHITVLEHQLSWPNSSRGIWLPRRTARMLAL